LREDISDEERLECAAQLADEIEDWHKTLPPLLSQQRSTILLPLFRRQTTLLRLAHYQAQMLVYRPFLTCPYPHWGQRKHNFDVAIRNCIEAAKLTIGVLTELARNLEPRMFGNLWYAHQVGYLVCAILLLVPHVRERQRMFGGRSFRESQSTDAKNIELAEKIATIFAENTSPFSVAPDALPS